MRVRIYTKNTPERHRNRKKAEFLYDLKMKWKKSKQKRFPQLQHHWRHTANEEIIIWVLRALGGDQVLHAAAIQSSL